MNRNSHKPTLHSTRLVGTLLAVVLSVLVASMAQAADYQDCIRCHESALDGAELRYNLHVPFAQRTCAACHEAIAPEKVKQTKVASRLGKKRQKVAWLGDSSKPDTEHGFVLSSEKLGETMVVDLQGRRGKLPRREIAVPLLAQLDVVEDRGVTPTISGVEVLQVKRGVFLSVTIGWQTDTLTAALVRYGEDELLQSSDRSERLGKTHEVTLYDLKPDKTYHYQVIATDMFGNSQTSDMFSFTTEKPMDRGVTADKVDFGAEEELEMESSFRRLGRDYLVELSMSSPVSLYVGSKGEIRRQKDPVARSQAADVDEAGSEHKGLSGGVALNIASCRNCHRDQNSTTHPVNVLPKADMIIPPEYPTLPDGRITCASCHFTHSSNNEYLAIKPGKRELCVGCHKDML